MRKIMLSKIATKMKLLSWFEWFGGVVWSLFFIEEVAKQDVAA